MLPAWATVLIALGASAIGGVMGVWLQSEHDRRERFRDRMIEAADDYNRAFAQVLLCLSKLKVEADDDDDDRARKSSLEARRNEAEKLIETAMLLRSRVDLLFSADSAVREAAQAAIDSGT